MAHFHLFLLFVTGVLVSGLVGGMVSVQAQSRTAILYNYSRMALKDLDEMNKLVKEKIAESKTSKGDKITPLREAMQAVYARPNDDFLIDKVMSSLRNELDEHGAWESTLKSLVEESVQALQKPDKVKPAAQVTYAIMLENIMAEMKPRADEPFEKSILVMVRDADISLTKKATNERNLGMMRPTKSPSEIATTILKHGDTKKK